MAQQREWRSKSAHRARAKEFLGRSVVYSVPTIIFHRYREFINWGGRFSVMKEIINYGGRLVGYETIMKEKFEIIWGVLSVLKNQLNISSPSPMSDERN